jgi:hypothetical protein
MKSSRPARVLTEAQWWAKARRHQKWWESWLAEMAALEATIDRLKDPQALQRIIDRAETIERRERLLKRIMARHFERAPAELLPELRLALRHQMH